MANIQIIRLTSSRTEETSVKKQDDAVCAHGITISNSIDDPAIKRKFAVSMKAARNKKGISREQLVKQICQCYPDTSTNRALSTIDVFLIGKWENPKLPNMPGTQPLFYIARLLGMSLDEILASSRSDIEEIHCNEAENFGTALKYHLTKQGMKQTELANKIGVHKSAISKWIGNAKAPADYIDCICKLLNCTRDDLFFGKQA